MIKTIYLHIGIHKTGTTSIQKALGSNHNLLASNGYLYPIFKRSGNEFYNHSVVFFSMFCADPINYHQNILNSDTNPEAIETLHKHFHEQLIKQIQNFKGDKMIISGEDISSLWLESLKKFKNYLREITNPDVCIEVILFCRHPVTWSTALIQEVIKGGNSMEKAKNNNKNLLLDYYHNKIIILSKVFTFESIHLYRFEDSIKNQYGPVGTFLSCIHAEDSFIKSLNLKNELHNVSISYEATRLLNAIYTKAPRFIDHQANPELSNFIPELIHRIPGAKFCLEEHHNFEIWQNSQQDVDWLCKNFNLPLYDYSARQNEYDVDKWSEKSLSYLKKTLPAQPSIVRKIIMREILIEIIRFKKSFSNQKKQSLFASFMYNSFYLELHSRYSKFRYLCKFLGLRLAFIASMNYLIQNIKSEKTPINKTNSN
jgi:hypothetical protein